MTHSRTRQNALAVLIAYLLSASMPAGPAAAQIDPTAFACDGRAYNVQREESELLSFSRMGMSFEFEPVGLNLPGDDGDDCCDPGEPCYLTDPDVVMDPPSISVNNMGFRKTDGMLYALELTDPPHPNGEGNNGIIKINNQGEITRVPSTGLPTTVRYDAGDVSESGDTMYINQAGISPLWVVDLEMVPAMATFVTITGSETGPVNDWAFNPADGNLYGGDSQGQVAQLDPVTGARTDFTVSDLPSGTAFGAAWFDATGSLFLYQNEAPGTGSDCMGLETPQSGVLYEIELTSLAPPAGEIVNQQSGPFTEGRNDGAACIPMPPYLGAAKEMTVDSSNLPTTVTIEYVFENFGTTSPDDDMTDLSAIDNLELVFGIAGVDWTFTSIASNPLGFFNPSFDGSAFDPMDPLDPEIQLISQSPPDNNLPAGDPSTPKTLTVVIELLTLAAGTETPPGSGIIEFCNQVNVQALNNSGELIGDLSFGGPDPDPDMDGIPAEEQASCIQFGDCCDFEFIKTGTLDTGGDGTPTPGDVITYTFLVASTGSGTVTDILVSDPLVSPITCPSGNPIPSLGPGESETCTGTYAIIQADIDNCSVFNIASAEGLDPAGAPVTVTDTYTEPIPPAPDIEIVKDAIPDDGGDGWLDVGDIIDYLFTVENLGNGTLSDVSVSDPIVAPIVCPNGNPIPTMAPGEFVVCTGSYVITMADVDAQQRCNTATVTGNQPTACGPGTVTDDDTVCVPIDPPPPPFPIPTLGDWGLLALALALAGFGVRRLRRP